MFRFSFSSFLAVFVFSVIGSAVLLTGHAARAQQVPVESAGLSPKLPIYTPGKYPASASDWLLQRAADSARVLQSADGRDLILYNGLVRRTFRIRPSVTCIDYTNLQTGRQLLRAVREETRITIDKREFRIGGLTGQKEWAYLLPEWLDSLTPPAAVFQFLSYQVKPLLPVVNWKPGRFWATRTLPGAGTELVFLYRAAIPELEGVTVEVHYGLYNGLPLIVKSVTIENKGRVMHSIDRVVNEVLAMPEDEAVSGGNYQDKARPDHLYLESDYAFNGSFAYLTSEKTMHYHSDSLYFSQSIGGATLLEVYPDKVSGIDLPPGERFQSVRSHELLMGNYTVEQRGLAIRRMYPVIAPWVTANPIFMHLLAKNDRQVYTAIDQCVATGYEAVIMSFGSYLNMEDTTAANLQKWKAVADYAHSKGIKLGGYSLFTSRTISPQDDVIDPATGKPGGALYGHGPCFGSVWGLWYRATIKNFYATTGFDIWENDGPYPGDLCASTTHPGHKGLDDSQWRQAEIQKELYRWLNARGVYINAPDWYFLDGTNKIAMGYREENFSLSRAEQVLLNRQNIYDDSWVKTPSMGWGFVPLTVYHGGGAAATLEPLSTHLKTYRQLMMQYYGAGVQACYRGPRLYDTDSTRIMVANTISWYKRYRAILNSDVIHLRRADGRDWDGILHVNPLLKQKGLMMLYNPTPVSITRRIKIPLYYTGLGSVAKVREQEGVPKVYRLDRDYSIDLDVTIGPDDYTWFVIE